MDIDEYLIAAHQSWGVCNPISTSRREHLIREVSGDTGRSHPRDLLDLGSGVGELAIGFANAGFRVTAVDHSPVLTREAEKKASGRGVAERMTVVCEDARSFVENCRERFSVIVILGASHPLGGVSEALNLASHLTIPGGRIIFGESYFRIPPSEEAMLALELDRNDFATLDSLNAQVASSGLGVQWSDTVSTDEWDAYEESKFEDIQRYVDTEVDIRRRELSLTRALMWRVSYLQHGRTLLGFALYVLRTS